MAREKCGLLVGPCTVPVSRQVLSMFVLSVVSDDVSACHYVSCMYSAWNPKDNYDMACQFFCSSI
jgi:hypothetical protein